MNGDLAARLLRTLPAETAHRATVRLVGLMAPLLSGPPADDARLRVSAFGFQFPNPVGLAAGFDKDAEVPNAMLKLGFGFVECGTVTPRPQAGNPRPRVFRLPEDGAVINRMGFNNQGMEAAARRLEARQGKGIVGINIGANKDSGDRVADYAKGFARLAPLADYVTVNVSSPNTPGLRGLQNKQELTGLLSALMETRAGNGFKPVLLKIAPDLDDHALDTLLDVDADGWKAEVADIGTYLDSFGTRTPTALKAEQQRVAVRRPADHQLQRLAHGRHVGGDVQGVGQHQQAHQRDRQPAGQHAADVRRQSAPGDPADARTDHLHRDHQRCGQRQRPEQPGTVGRPGLRVGGQAAGVVVGGAGDQARPEAVGELSCASDREHGAESASGRGAPMKRG